MIRLPLTFRVVAHPDGRIVIVTAGRVQIGRFPLRALTHAVTRLKEGDSFSEIVNPVAEEPPHA